MDCLPYHRRLWCGRLGFLASCPEVGSDFEGLPKFFCSKVRVSDDKAWTEEEGKFSEKPLLDKVRERIREGVRKALEDNARLLKNSHCKLRDCEFVVELEKGARLIFKRPYPIPEAFQEAVNNCCQEWLDNGWVKLLPPDQRNDWNSPLLTVKKVSGNKWLGDIRLCMDFRWVNVLTLDPAFMIPLCREMLEKLVGMRIFSELDLVNTYHQVPLSKESMLCTGFTIPGKGQAVWTVLFFETKGAVTFFQKVIELALGNLTGSMVIVIYVDNILVGSLEVESHVRELVKVIEALMAAGLKLKPAKCKFGYEAIGFMGVILSGERRGVDPYKARVFSEMLRLKGGKEVQSVLGFVNFL